MLIFFSSCKSLCNVLSSIIRGISLLLFSPLRSPIDQSCERSFPLSDPGDVWMFSLSDIRFLLLVQSFLLPMCLPFFLVAYWLSALDRRKQTGIHPASFLRQKERSVETKGGERRMSYLNKSRERRALLSHESGRAVRDKKVLLIKERSKWRDEGMKGKEEWCIKRRPPASSSRPPTALSIADLLPVTFLQQDLLWVVDWTWWVCERRASF